MEQAAGVLNGLRDVAQSRLGSFQPLNEFFAVQRVSVPPNLNEATRRISYNLRHFGPNYSVILAILALYALLTNIYLLIALIVLVVGYAAANRFGAEPYEVAGQTITQKHLYAVITVVGLVVLWISGPFSTVFWLVGVSVLIVGAHASILEPGIEEEYATMPGGQAHV